MMELFPGDQPSITEGSRALHLFTDRREAIRSFIESMHGEPRDRILFFHGDGGNGKSLLLRHLSTTICRQLPPEEWDRVNSSDGHDLAHYIQGSRTAKPIPFALLDFQDPSSREPYSAITKLRRELAGNGLSFPMFDFAIVWYLQQSKQLTRERLRDVFPVDGLDLASTIMDASSSTSYGAIGKVVLRAVNKKMGPSFTLYRQKRHVDEETIQGISSLDYKTDLIAILPRLLAEDLSASMKLPRAPGRLVLFFDTHEAFFGHERDVAYARRGDDWVRVLLSWLELRAGIVVAIAGREPPRWSEDRRAKAVADKVELTYVGGLPDSDARDYLRKAGVANPELRYCILEYSREGPNIIHPWFLGLCADIVLAAAKKHETLRPEDFGVRPETLDKGEDLVARLLKWVDDDVRHAVEALSACRSFDRAIYEMLGDALRFHASSADFNELKRFSFIRMVEGERYRIHDLLRRMFREQGQAPARAADEVLEAYYRERAEAGGETALTEAIYHANRLDWKRGIKLWLTAFEESLSLSRYGVCRLLIEVRRDLYVGDEFCLGRISTEVGEYHATLARHTEAREEYSEAIRAYDKALALAPDHILALNNKGLALMKLSELQDKVEQHERWKGSVRGALESWERSLSLAPGQDALREQRDRLREILDESSDG